MPGYQFRSRAAAASPSPAAEFARYLLDDRGSAIGGECSRSFDVLLYSRYKYGSATAAGVLARALGTAFLARYRELVARPRLLVAASPYHHVPTAAHALAVRFTAMLSAERTRYRLPPARLVRIDREVVVQGDYGTLPAAARARLMAANALSFDRLLPCAEGSHLIVVDDVKVTGAHQRCLLRASDPWRTGSTTHLSSHSRSLPVLSWRPTSAGTSASASSCSARPAAAVCRPSWPGSRITSSGSCTETAWWMVSRAWPLTARVMTSSAGS
jgi:hypothetical protein